MTIPKSPKIRRAIERKRKEMYLLKRLVWNSFGKGHSQISRTGRLIEQIHQGILIKRKTF